MRSKDDGCTLPEEKTVNINLKSLLIPIFIEQTILALSGFIGVAIAGHLGETVFSAVNVVDTVILVLQYLFVSAAVGGTVAVSKSISEKNREKIKNVIAQTVLLAFIGGIIAGICIIFMHRTIVTCLFSKAGNEMLSEGAKYLLGWGLSAPLYTVFQAGQGILRGLGETQKSMKYAIIANVSYLLTVWFFIDLINIGVYAFAAAFLVSRTVGLLLQIKYFCMKNKDWGIGKKDFRQVDVEIVKELLIVGIPFIIEQQLFYGGKIITQSLVVSLGETEILVNAICTQIINIYFIPMTVMSLGIATAVGTCIGAKREKAAGKYIKQFSLIADILTAAIYIASFICMDKILDLFTADELVISQVKQLLTLCFVGAVLFTGRSYIYPAGLRAAGDAVFSSVSSIVIMWLVRILGGYVGGIVLNFRLIGIYAFMVAEWIVRGVLYTARLKIYKNVGGTLWKEYKEQL